MVNWNNIKWVTLRPIRQILNWKTWPTLSKINHQTRFIGKIKIRYHFTYGHVHRERHKVVQKVHVINEHYKGIQGSIWLSKIKKIHLIHLASRKILNFNARNNMEARFRLNTNGFHKIANRQNSSRNKRMSKWPIKEEISKWICLMFCFFSNEIQLIFDLISLYLNHFSLTFRHMKVCSTWTWNWASFWCLYQWKLRSLSDKPIWKSYDTLMTLFIIWTNRRLWRQFWHRSLSKECYHWSAV